MGGLPLADRPSRYTSKFKLSDPIQKDRCRRSSFLSLSLQLSRRR